MLVLHVALHALGAELALVEGELLPRLEADDLVVLHLELDAALLAAEAAVRLHEPVGLAGARPAAGRLAVEMRAELRDQLDESGSRRRQLWPSGAAPPERVLGQREVLAAARRADVLVVRRRPVRSSAGSSYDAQLALDLLQIVDVHPRRERLAAPARSAPARPSAPASR